MKIRHVFGIGLLFAWSASAFAGAGFWSSTGPHGGNVFEVKFNPTTPTIVYANTSGGFFKSTNRGNTWSRAENGLVGGPAFSGGFVVDPDAPNNLYILGADGRLFRSIDGALNWTPTGFTVPVGNFVSSIADVSGNTTDLVIAMNASNGVPSPTETYLLRSADQGATFSPPTSGIPAGVTFETLKSDPNSAGTLLAGIAYVDAPPPSPFNTIYRSGDGGNTWSAVRTSLSVTPLDVIGLGFGAGDTVYANENGTVLRSTDNGLTWTARTGFASFDLAAHPTIADEVWSSGSVSTDGGNTFAPQNAGLDINPSHLDANGLPVYSNANKLTFDPAYPAPNTAIWAATGGAGIMRRNIGTTTWVPLTNAISSGLAAVGIRGLAINPNPSAVSGGASQYVFAGYTDGLTGATPGIYQFDGSASTWFPSNTGLELNSIRSITIDPISAGTTLANVSNSVIYAGGGPVTITAARNFGIFRSLDNGSTWATMDGNLPRSVSLPSVAFTTKVRDTELDPRSCGLAPFPTTGSICTVAPGAQLKRLYATSSGTRGTLTPATPAGQFRVLRSDNANTTSLNARGEPDVLWTDLTSNLPPFSSGALITPVNILLDPNNSNRLFIGTFTSLQEGVTDVANGVFRSDDGGLTWLHKSNGIPRPAGKINAAYSVLSLAIHPSNGNILWASVVDSDINPSSGSIYKTTDGGETWFESAAGINNRIDIRDILVDQSNPNRLYASGAGTPANPAAVYRSMDGGATWQSISVGLPASSALALERDPFNNILLYAGTNNGVWSIEQVPDADGDGIPDTTEANVPTQSAVAGDGNGDGTADAVQGDVGSSGVDLRRELGSNSKQAKVLGFFTTDVVSGTGGACNQAVDVQGKLAARNGLDYVVGSNGATFSYPQELVRFDLQDCATAQVDVTFHNADFSKYGWSFRFYGPLIPGDDGSVGWYDFSSRATKLSNKKWRLNLDKTQLGSYRDPSSNTILFEGGAACNDDRLMQNGFEDNQVLTPPSCAQ